MYELLTPAEAKKADALALEGRITERQLMDAAGSSVAEEAAARFSPCPVLVLCGPGNNGGDGFVVAHRLRQKGFDVRVAATDSKKKDLQKIWDGKIEALNSNLSVRDTALVIDAVFGVGFDRALEPELITLFDKIRARKIPVIAVDVPSGLNAATGAVAAGVLKAEVTVTFTRAKIGQRLLPGKTFCGEVVVANIGIDDETVASLGTQCFENHPALWLRDFPLPAPESHKYSRGHTVVYGGAARTGAACLAAGAAQRAGSGAVTIAAPAAQRDLYAGYRASLMVDERDSVDDWKNLLRDERKNAVVIGPGAGADAATRQAVLALLSFRKSGVIDADALIVFAENPKDLFSALSPAYVLTPHAGEFERLFGHLDGDKPERARKAAQMANAIIVLKGSDTVIAAPDGTTVINTNAPATLATAGSGDVLAGIITGLIAQGMPPFMAAAAGVWLHGQAARIHGAGLTPEDIIFNISQALNTLFRTS